MNERFDDVVEFAEIGDAIDAPVQTYSSGMAARLGFSSAIHTEPEILLIDEVLAVGDVKFRGKCIRRLAKLREKGTSFIFVSHNSMAILAVSTSAVYLQKGRTLAVGSPEAIIQKYEEDLFINGKLTMPGSISIPEKDSAESSGVDLLNIYFQDREGNNIEELATGKFADCVVGFKAHEKFQDISVRAEIKEIGGEGETVLFLSSYLDLQTFDIDSGKHKIHLTMPYIGLKPGIYTMNLNIRKGSNYIFDTVESFRFVVKGDAATFKNAFYQPHSWEISN